MRLMELGWDEELEYMDNEYFTTLRQVPRVLQAKPLTDRGIYAFQFYLIPSR